MSEIPITVAKKNASMNANYCGDIEVKTFNGKRYASKKMQNVLFVKDLKCNLLSVKCLARIGYKVVFQEKATIWKNEKN